MDLRVPFLPEPEVEEATPVPVDAAWYPWVPNIVKRVLDALKPQEEVVLCDDREGSNNVLASIVRENKDRGAI